MEESAQKSAETTPVSSFSKKSKAQYIEKESPRDDAIDDEIGEIEAPRDEELIEDFYEDINPEKKQKEEDEGELDLDYSQTHLDDFIKSQTGNSMFKGSNVQSQ